jgi:hypothetical protein
VRRFSEIKSDATPSEGGEAAPEAAAAVDVGSEGVVNIGSSLGEIGEAELVESVVETEGPSPEILAAIAALELSNVSSKIIQFFLSSLVRQTAWFILAASSPCTAT